MHKLDFETLRKINVQRSEESFFPLESWGASDWGNALAGEVGEACNIAKKMRRHELNPKFTDGGGVEALRRELADVVLYADLFAARYGIDLGLSVAEKFNEVSDRVESTLKLDVPKKIHYTIFFCHDLEDSWYDICSEANLVVRSFNQSMNVKNWMDELTNSHTFSWGENQEDRYKPDFLK